MWDLRAFGKRMRNWWRLFNVALRVEVSRLTDELGESIREEFAPKDDSFFNTGDKVRAGEGSALYQATYRGQPGNIFHLMQPASGGLLDAEFGIDLDQVPGARIQELGGSIVVTDKMLGFFFAMYTNTLQEEWLWTYMGAKKRGYIDIPARPYFGPAMKKWETTRWVTFLKRVPRLMRRVWDAMK